MKNPKAFPALCDDHSCDDGGMILRDWFAGQALTAIVTLKPDTPDGAAWAAYQIADAMLAARGADQ